MLRPKIHHKGRTPKQVGLWCVDVDVYWNGAQREKMVWYTRKITICVCNNGCDLFKYNYAMINNMDFKQNRKPMDIPAINGT